MNRRWQWALVLCASIAIVDQLWTMGDREDEGIPEGRSHIALILPIDGDRGDVMDVVVVHARTEPTGTSSVQLVTGEDQRILWTTEVPGMGVTATQGARVGAVGRGFVALSSRVSDGDRQHGVLSVLDSRDGRLLWESDDVPETCEGYWTDVMAQGDALVSFCRNGTGHALRIHSGTDGEVLWEHDGFGEIMEVGPLLLTGMVILPDPVHGRWVRLDGTNEGSLRAPGQVYVSDEHVTYARRWDECASRYRLERMNRVGITEVLPLTDESGCLPEGISPFQPMGWAPGTVVGVTVEGALVGVSGDTTWRIEFPEEFRHRGLFYEHKRRATELSALHGIPGRYHPFVLRSEGSEDESHRLAIVDLTLGQVVWQSASLRPSTPWVSRHILVVDQQFLILLPDGDSTHLLSLDPTTGEFTAAVEIMPEEQEMTSTELLHHNLVLHLYPERFEEGRIYGSARERVFSIDTTDWQVRAYRGEPPEVISSWRSVETLLGPLPRVGSLSGTTEE